MLRLGETQHCNVTKINQSSHVKHGGNYLSDGVVWVTDSKCVYVQIY